MTSLIKSIRLQKQRDRRERHYRGISMTKNEFTDAVDEIIPKLAHLEDLVRMQGFKSVTVGGWKLEILANTQHCQTCKYWYDLENPIMGDCSKLSRRYGSHGGQPTGLVYIADFNNNTEVEVATDPMFGCVLWEHK